MLFSFFRYKHFRTKREKSQEKNYEQFPVSIIKPLKGFDENLRMNLLSFFTMNYPKFELLFCVVDQDDVAIEIVKNLMNLYPQVDTKLIIGGSNCGINPKVNNMNPAYKNSKYDLIMISDDKMVIQPDDLEKLVDRIVSDVNVGIVTQIPYYRGYDNECLDYISKVGLACFLIKCCFILDLFKRPRCSGMSTLYKREIFKPAGGLEYFGKHLDEDIRILTFAEQNGWKISFADELCLQNASEISIKLVYKRFVRWNFITDWNSWAFLIGTTNK